jgi:glutathione S-transferase
MVKRRLYHYPMSPYSRRTRLALAHKGLEVELLDGRADPAKQEEARRLVPLRTIPVLVEPDGRAIGDSTAIAHYLDRAYPEGSKLWPTGADDGCTVLEATTLVDVVLNITVDVGTRYYALRQSPAWGTVKDEMVGRAQTALDALAARAPSRNGRAWTDAGWGVADMWLASAVLWMEGWPARAPQTPVIGQILSLGLRLPQELSRWTDTHRGRADIAALG